MKITIIVI